MQTAGGLVKYVSDILNDQEAGFTYQVWTEAFLLNALNDAASRIATNIPWLFRAQSDITLTPGGATTIPTEMQYQSDIVGQVCIKNGVQYLRTDITQSKDTQLNKPSACCPPSDGMFSRPKKDPNDPCSAFQLSQWAITKDAPGILMVAPDVPNGVSPIIRISYMKVPVFAIGDTLGAADRFSSLIVDWMLNRAYSVDIKTPEVNDRAKLHEAQFVEGIKATIGVLMSQERGRRA